MYTEFAIIILIIVLLIISNKTVEGFQGIAKYGMLNFKWIKDPADIRYKYISHDDGTIYVPDPSVLTNKRLYSVNA